jgi:hypothetical protein
VVIRIISFCKARHVFDGDFVRSCTAEIASAVVE